MTLDRATVEDIVAVLNKAFEVDGDVFGMMHNTAVDVLCLLEGALEEQS